MYNIDKTKWKEIQDSLKSLGPKLFFEGGPMSAVDSIWAAVRTIEAWMEWFEEANANGGIAPVRKEMSPEDFPESKMQISFSRR